MISIKGKKYRLDDPNITIDEATGEYALKSELFRFSSEVDFTTGELGLDKYTSDHDSTVTCFHSRFGNFVLQNVESAKKHGLVEGLRSGKWYLPNEKEANDTVRKYQSFDNTYKESTKNLAKDFALGIASPTFLITEGKRYSFGVELETSRGIIPSYIYKDWNFKAVHDGSLRDRDGEVWGKLK